jgi:autotransporter-associated beta strand protein
MKKPYYIYVGISFLAIITISSMSYLKWYLPHATAKPTQVTRQNSVESIKRASKLTDTETKNEESISNEAFTPQVSQIAGLPATPMVVDFTKIESFKKWSLKWQEARPAERSVLTAEGVAMAKTRRPEFKKLIITDPQRALAEAVPRVIRQDLPKEIKELLETPVSTQGEYNVYYGKPLPGAKIVAEDLTKRYFEVGDKHFIPHVFGKLVDVSSKKKLPLRGVAIERDFAVAESAVRVLEVGERIEPGTTVSETCPVSGLTTSAISLEEPITAATPTVEIADKFIRICDDSHAEKLDRNFQSYIMSNGPGGGGYFYDNFPNTASRSIGNFRCLYIRATYPDQQTQPNTEEQAYTDMKDSARFYLENSYGKLTQTSTVTPLVTLSRTLAWYYSQANLQDTLGLIHKDSSDAALLLGYDSSQFDCTIVRIDRGPGLDNNAYGGGSRVWTPINGMDILNHECGHALGLPHAKFWSSLDGTPYGYGQNDEYGNYFDVMGNGYGYTAHYNSVNKRKLGWLPDSTIHFAKGNGTYRIYAYDQPTLEVGKRYGLSAKKDSIRQCNLEFHPSRGGHLVDSALVIYSGMTSNGFHLVDTTPGSSRDIGDSQETRTIKDREDGGISVGTTYSDREADMHFTVLGVNDTTPKSLDVVFNRGPFLDNVAPTATLTSSAISVPVGASVTFTAAASDANGDALAYRWECQDGQSGKNGATYTRSFNKSDQVTVMLTVSDMKGGTVRRSVVIAVGSHGKQSITGSVTAYGQPLQGVTFSVGSRFCYSNNDGTYSLAGLDSGSNVITAMLNGYTLTPGFSNPLNISSGVNTANWTAIRENTLTLTKVADALEGGTNGIFRLTRSGNTAAALVVLVSPVGGTASKNIDYNFTPNETISGDFRSFTIPAGSSSLDINVAAVNDILQEGPEFIILQIAGAAGYIANDKSAVIMTVGDNDTALPLVSVTATDPYATEAPLVDTSTFKFSRIGANNVALNLAVTWSGSASNGLDYSTLPSMITIPAGQNSVNVTVTPIDDTLIEKSEEVIATISVNKSIYICDSAESAATVSIADDDIPYVTISVPDVIAAESGLNSGVFLVTRTGSTTDALKVYYGLSGDALLGTDYAALTGEVIIPAGAASAPIVIKPYDDDIAEPTETATIELANFNDTYSLGSTFQGSISISDNGDTPLVTVRPGDYGTEGGGNSTFIFHSYGNGQGMFDINYTLSGTATSGLDYTIVSGTISVPVNGSNDTNLSIPIVNDSLVEPTETIILKITPSQNYRVYNDDIAEAIILDNDSGGDRVKVSEFNQNPSEAGLNVGKFYLSRIGSTGNLTVNYAISGSATNGIDCQTLSGNIVIPAGSTGVDLVMTPIDDNLVEGNETLTLTVLPGIGYSPDRPVSASYEIIDNEVLPLTVGFQSSKLSTSEKSEASGEYRDIAVVLSTVSTRVIKVNYGSRGGDATGGDVDWAFVDAAKDNKPILGGTLTFQPGVISQNIRIRVKDDGVSEGVEIAMLELKSPENATLTIEHSLFNITIYDDNIFNIITEERWQDSSFYINNTWNTANPTHFGKIDSFSTVIDAADNYSRRIIGQIIAPTTGNHTFWLSANDQARLYLSSNSVANNKTLIASVNSKTRPQSWDEFSSQKSVSVNLTLGQSYYIEVQQQAYYGEDHVSVAWQGPGFDRVVISSVIPNTSPRTVRFVSSSSLVDETNGPATDLQVVLDRPAGNTPITVNYSSSGTATVGNDYIFTPGILTFLPGEQMKSIPLTVLADSIGEITETIKIALSSPSGASLASPAFHLIKLVDSGIPVVNSLFTTALSTQASGTVITTVTAITNQTITNWSISSGNTGNAFTINSGGQLILSVPSAIPNPGGMQLIIRAEGNPGFVGFGTVNVVCNPELQSVTEQRWAGTVNYANQTWSGTPGYSGTLTTLITPENVSDNYSRRLTSFLKPQISGDYIFWIAGDDDCRLFLSPDNKQANKVQIATMSGYNNSPLSWDNSVTQKSVSIPLVADQVYWIEAQQQEMGGNDFVSVAWAGPGITREVIPANALIATNTGVVFNVQPTPVVIMNTPPIISQVSDVTLSKNSSSAAIPFSVSDVETPVNSLLVSASSSNYLLLPNSRIVLAGSGAGRTLVLSPLLNQTGTATITLILDDGSLAVTRTFSVTVTNTIVPPTQFTWSVATFGDWADSTNWDGGIAPVNTGLANYTLNFNATSSCSANCNLNSGFLLNQLNFSGSTVGITGSSLTLSPSGSTFPQINQNAAVVSIGNNLVMAANTIVGGISDGSLSLAGVISGASSLTKSSGGELILSGANSHTLGTVVDAGTLTLKNQSGLGSGLLTLAAGSVFQQDGFEGNAVVGAIPNAIALSGVGNVTLNMPFSKKDIWLSKEISGTGGFTVQGGIRSLTLTANNSFSGGVRLTDSDNRIQIAHLNSLGTGIFRSERLVPNSGRLVTIGDLSSFPGVTNSFEITAGAYLNIFVDGENHLLLSGSINSNFGMGNLYKDGAATLVLSGTNSYSGSTTVNGGMLACNSISSLGGGALVINSGAKLKLNYYGSRQVASLTLNGVLQPNGRYGSSVSLADNGVNIFFDGNGTVSVGPLTLTAYEIWANGVDQSFNEKGPLDDPDHDGVSNLLEFTLGSNPMRTSSSLLPKMTVTSNSMVFEYDRSNTAVNIVQIVEYGNDLIGWTPIKILPVTSGVNIMAGNTSAHVKVTIPLNGGQNFARLRVRR